MHNKKPGRDKLQLYTNKQRRANITLLGIMSDDKTKTTVHGQLGVTNYLLTELARGGGGGARKSKI